MARTTSLPTFATLADAQAAILDLRPDTLARRESKSGGEWHNLTDRMHAADPTCNVCGLPTVRTRWNGPMTATLATLIPCSVLDDFGGALRFGYLFGNLDLFCRACVDAANNYGQASGAPVVFGAGDLLRPERVMLAPIQLRKTSAPVAPTGPEAALLHRVAPTHKARAAASRAANGFPF